MRARRKLSSQVLSPWRVAAVAAALALAAGCGASSPTAPEATPAPAASNSLTGVVRVGSSGAPVGGARVDIVAGVNSGRHAEAGPDGKYAFDQLEAGDLSLHATAEGYAERTVDMTVAGATYFDVRLTPASGTPSTGSPTPPGDGTTPDRVVLTGTVADGAGAPLASARVAIVAGENSGRAATTDAGGRYRLTDLTPGDATLEISASGFDVRRRTVHLAHDDVVDVTLSRSAPATLGRAIGALTGEGLPGVRVSGDGIAPVTTGADGTFSLTMTTPTLQTLMLSFSGAGVVERRTHARVPDTDLRVSLIPDSFNLRAFDEMLREPALRRWTRAPSLLVERRALTFTSEDMTGGPARAELMDDWAVGSLVTDLTWALPQLTGDTFVRFGDVQLRATPEGADVALLNDGVITVVRVVGLTDGTGYWGFSRWQYAADGTVTGGVMFLDAEFDGGSSPFKRALRAHELGHALGYAHVTQAASVMNASARLEPTDFDRDACRIAFARAPGNRAPDIDPDEVSLNRLGPVRWSRPIR
ncbi:MAG: carboxypeptidase regulatory-like domain-containing protein [Vicinamibacterales bacterium]